MNWLGWNICKKIHGRWPPVSLSMQVDGKRLVARDLPLSPWIFWKNNQNLKVENIPNINTNN
jgi:hypothetical protein